MHHSRFLATLETCKVIETFSPSTMIFHQLYKRVWPSSQRETLFMSHIREIPSSDVSVERLEDEVGNPWLSINYSIDHPDVPVSWGQVRTQPTSYPGFSLLLRKSLGTKLGLNQSPLCTFHSKSFNHSVDLLPTDLLSTSRHWDSFAWLR